MAKLDVIVDLQYGDTGKGKVAHFLCKGKKKYTHVLRYNGGANAGHTVFHKGKKFVTHQVPVGVFYGIRSVIGADCVVDPVALKKEIAELEREGIKVNSHLSVARNAHVVTKQHLREDSGGASDKIGTTRRGIGPAFRDKYARVGLRAEQVKELKPYLIDLYEEFHGPRGKKTVVLGEGAQGFALDIDWGDYPFVTSSHCTVGGALLSGFPPQSLRHIWGVAKAYETRVGKTRVPFEPKEKIFEKIREEGQEYGATTGRPRQCNWVDVSLLKKAAKINGVTHLVINKIDVLNRVGVWKAREGKKVVAFGSGDELKRFITKHATSVGIKRSNIFFSENKDRV